MSSAPLRPAAHRLISKIEQKLGRTRLLSRPAIVDVVLTKACNLSCTFCRDYEHPGARKVSPEQMECIAAQLFPTARWVNICSGGEPYLHTGLEHLLRLARGHGARTWVLSNGMLVEEGRLARMLEQDLITEHGFSVDGIKAETVEGIRTGAHLPTILKNIDTLLQLRGPRSGSPVAGSSGPGVVVRYALMRRNIDELPEAVSYWGHRGIERLDAGYLNLANGIDRDESLYFHQDHMLRVFDRAREVARSFPQLTLSLPPSVAEQQELQRNPSACRSPWEFVMIDTSGRVLPCYRAFEALHMGQLHGDGAQDFSDIWNSTDYQALRRTVNDDSGPKHYSFCSVCEKRRGWGSADSHLGDETWRRMAFEDQAVAEGIDHRRTGYRSLESWDAAQGSAGPQDHGPGSV